MPSGGTSASGGSDNSSAGTSPMPTGKMLGESCDTDSDCASGDCPFGLSYCTQGCSDFADCPSFWECKPVGASAQKVCQK
jgi:hypothetical protein